MPSPLSELIKKRIIKTYETTNKSQQAIADEFGCSIGTVRRLTKGKVRAVMELDRAVRPSIAQGHRILVDDLDVTEYLKTAIKDASGAIAGAEAKSKEGMAGALARLITVYRAEMPKTLEALVDQLLAHPDFSMEKIGPLIRDRYAQKAS
jgi:transcriptional regulator with XRE-family HTH domain